MGLNEKQLQELNQKLDKFLGNIKKDEHCENNECIVNNGEGLIERVNKVYKTNDGRQLLM